MKPIEILEKIIEQMGDCDDVLLFQCKNCPLSKLKTKSDGSPMSCIDATGTSNMKEIEANAVYLELAQRKLADIKMEEILEEEDVVK